MKVAKKISPCDCYINVVTDEIINPTFVLEVNLHGTSP